MLGLHTKNGWRALFAVAVTGTLIGIGSGAAVAAPAVTRAEAQAVNGTGAIVEILDTGDCKTTAPVAYPGTADRCGEGLSSAAVSAFAQAVEGRTNGFSRGFASAAPIDVDGLGEISLQDIFAGLADADTGTILDPLLNALGALGDPLEPLLAPLDDVLDQVLTSVNGALPVNLQLGAVESQCSATASPLNATGSSVVADANIVVGEGVLGANGVVVPLTGPNAADTPPNTNLLVGAPEDLVDAIIDAVQDTLTQSLGDEIAAGPLEPINLLLAPIQDQVLDALFETLEPALLEPLAEALEPLVQGTVNKQTTGTGSIEVIALEVILLEAAGPSGTQTLQLARTSCGRNTAGTTATPTPPVNDDGGDDGDDGDGDDSDDSDDGDGDDDEPKVVDSGINDGGNLGALAITGLLAASTLVGSAARQRLLLGQ